MKERSKGIIIGASLSLLVIATTTSALAATGQMTITVDPINIQVNGTTFTPKDAQGNSVPVFKYDGTTYAPLRALAEAYGLNVGYDSKNNMATVGAAASTETPTPSPSQAPDNTASSDYSDWSAEEEAAYQEFKGMWEVEFTKLDEKWNINHYKAIYVGNDDAATVLKTYSRLEDLALRLAYESFDDLHQLQFVFVTDVGVIGSCQVMLHNGTWSMGSTMSP